MPTIIVVNVEGTRSCLEELTFRHERETFKCTVSTRGHTCMTGDTGKDCSLWATGGDRRGIQEECGPGLLKS